MQHYSKGLELYSTVGNPPDFKPVSTDGFTVLAAKALAEFYTKANIAGLYKKYKSSYDKAMAEYQKAIYDPLTQLTGMLKIPLTDIPKFKVLVNLLDSYYRGYNLGNVGDSTFLITGNSEEPNVRNILHEYAHTFSNPPIPDFTREQGQEPEAD